MRQIKDTHQNCRFLLSRACAAENSGLNNILKIMHFCSKIMIFAAQVRQLQKNIWSRLRLSDWSLVFQTNDKHYSNRCLPCSCRRISIWRWFNFLKTSDFCWEVMIFGHPSEPTSNCYLSSNMSLWILIMSSNERRNITTAVSCYGYIVYRRIQVWTMLWKDLGFSGKMMS